MRAVHVFVALGLVASFSTRASMATVPPAYLPELSVRSLSVSSPAKQPSGGYVQLTPSGCSGTACSGFRASNAADFNSRTNSATFGTNSARMQVDPFNPTSFELGTFQLSNGGYMVPADGGAALVPLSASLQITTQGTDKSTAVTLPFLVMWTPGSPASPNNAGLFTLVTKQSGSTPAPTRQISVALAPEVDFTMKLELLGFVAANPGNSNVSILGDWGQQPPPAGQPGPRVFVKQGAGPQAVKLVARTTRQM